MNIISVVLISIVVIYCLQYIIRSKEMYNYINIFESYNAVLTYNMEKAYNIIYKDKILIYSVEGTRPTEADFVSHTMDFCHLVLKLMGPSLQEEFSKLYGNEDTLIFVITEYFNDRSENDEIREASINELMEKDIDEK